MMVEIGTVLSFIQASGIVVAYYVMNIQNNQRTQQQTLETRQAQLFIQIYNKTTSEEGIEYQRMLAEAEFSNYDEWLEKYNSDSEYRKAFLWMSYVYEGIGVFLKEGLVNIRLIALFMAGVTRLFWERYRDVIYRERDRMGYRRFASEWEYTYNELMRYMKEHPEVAT
jgi:hypothetical protein